MRRRVAITGIGIVSPHGSDYARMFDDLLAGRSAIRRISIASGDDALETVAAPVDGEPWLALPRGERVMADRASQYALLAAQSAVADAGLDFAAEDTRRAGVSVGTCMGGIATTEAAYEDLFRKGATRVSPFTLAKTMYNAPAAHIAMKYGLTGPSLTYTTTCSSSAVAAGEAMRLIRHGYADVMLAGGTDALLVYGSMRAWQALRILASEKPGHPEASCRPFSADRDGTVLGEGAAFLVLEDWDHAQARGATLHAELAGYAVTSDSTHLTQPSIEGQAHAMSAALDDARIAPGGIDYINAHGTGTALNDVSETRAIRRVLGARSDDVAVSSTKSMHGHLVGAAGAHELAIATLAVMRGAVPPTAHLATPDPECDLDYVPLVGRPARVRAAMTNSFAFGGTAAVLVVADPRESRT